MIVGNRGFFPGHLARTGRDEILQARSEEGYGAVILNADATIYGAIESRGLAGLPIPVLVHVRADDPAKMGIVLDRWMKEVDVTVSALVTRPRESRLRVL